MKKQKTSLTELEGAVLLEIRRIGVCTAYEVRRAFEKSPSLEWSGSSGAVYPAIKRLVGRNLIDTNPSEDDARGTLQLTLNKQGLSILQAWTNDIDRAVSPGFDPFRTRSIEWVAAAPAKRRAQAAKLEQALTDRIEQLEKIIKTEKIKSREQIELAQQRSRLAWVRKTLHN